MPIVTFDVELVPEVVELEVDVEIEVVMLPAVVLVLELPTIAVFDAWPVDVPDPEDEPPHP